MWIDDVVYIKKELEVQLITDKTKITRKAEIYLEVEVIGELNYSLNPEDYAFPDIEIKSLQIYLHSFHNNININSIEIPNFTSDLTVKTDSFDKTIESYEFIDLPNLNTTQLLLSQDNIQLKYEREAA